MDRRDTSKLFRLRLAQVLAAPDTVRSSFAKDIGVDRSALSQFLSPNQDRLPRAETLRRIAEVSGVSIDWLLGVENAQDGRLDVAASIQIERSRFEDGTTPLERWHAEARGAKLRYVPSSLPDMMNLVSSDKPGQLPPTAAASENVLEGALLDEMDIEIAMPSQTVRDLAARTGLWRGTDLQQCQRQLRYMARICKESYPRLRLHFFDGTKSFSAPFTVFGNQRVALYIGDAYLVMTGQDQVRAFSQRFDSLVRQSQVEPSQAHAFLSDLV